MIDGFIVLRNRLQVGQVLPAHCAARGDRLGDNYTWAAPEDSVVTPLAREIAEEVRGLKVERVGPTVIHRAAHDPPRGWHRDWPFWQDEHALDDQPPQLGVLFYPIGGTVAVIPGAHLRWTEIDDELLRSIPENFPRSPVVPYRRLDCERRVVLEPEDVLVIDARLPHAVPVDPRDRPAMNVWCWFFDVPTELSWDHSVLRDLS